MKKRNWRRHLWSVVVVLLAICLFSTGVLSKTEYPTKPITLIVPWAAGGVTDMAARALVSVIPEYLGQPVIVVNQPGAAGTIGAQYVVDSKPDGYIMLLASVGSNGVAPALNPDLEYKYNDFTSIAMTQVNPMLLVVNAKSSWHSVEDLVDALLADPMGTPYAFSPGVNEMAPPILIDAIPGVSVRDVIGIPYQNGVEAALAVLRGEAKWGINNVVEVKEHIKAGTIVPLATTNPERLPDFPDVPTMLELGYPQNVVGWRGVLGPPGLPEEIVDKWVNAINETTQNPAYLAMLEKFGDFLHVLGPEEFEEYIENEYITFSTIAKKIGLID